ncbi:hypothetical protein [Streptococcus dentiloxodontae]
MVQRLILFLLSRNSTHLLYGKINFYFFLIFFQAVKLLLLGGIIQYWFYNYMAVYSYYGMNFLSTIFGGGVFVGVVAAVFALFHKNYRSLKYIGALIVFPICFYSMYGGICLQYVALYWILNSIFKSYVARPVLAYSRLSDEFSPKAKERQKYRDTNLVYKKDQMYLDNFDGSLITLNKDIKIQEKTIINKNGFKLVNDQERLERTFHVRGYFGKVKIIDELDVSERVRRKRFKIGRGN